MHHILREKKDETPVIEVQPVDSSIDVGILKFQAQKVEFKDLQAKPEGGENPNKLISSLTEEEINEVYIFSRVWTNNNSSLYSDD